MIYIPDEDSYLLAEQVKKYIKGKTFLDIGSGSGIQAETALNNKAKFVLAADVEIESIKLLKSKGIQAIKSNLFSNLQNKKFDLIAFNPPYLPQDKREDKESQKATTGGKKGDEIILKFLKQAPKHLNKKGIILLVISSLTPQGRINKLLKKIKFKKTLLAEKKIFMEKLEVWRIIEVKK